MPVYAGVAHNYLCSLHNGSRGSGRPVDCRMNGMSDIEVRRHIATEIRVAMLRLGIRQHQLAAALDLHRNTMTAKMTGRAPFTTDELVAICEQLGLDLVDLMPGPSDLHAPV